MNDIEVLISGTFEEKIEVIKRMTEERLLQKIEESTVPDQLNYIVTEVAIKRFNRIKNEGMTAYSQEGESITFSTSDFDEFSDDINRYIDKKNKSKKAVKFINPFGG
ncbi:MULTISPECIES: phage head-tail connector protein [Listeria]|uniref:phage head-tail connector protein n=1 Tax=Listeria TaxID=1637 RepID=UPI000B58E6CF|nr:MULTISPECIES: phage head-tail connector protein [Listeria]